MILPLIAALAGWLLSAHFASVKTVLGLFWREGYVPPPPLYALEPRVRALWANPHFFVTVALGRTLASVLASLGFWTLVFPSGVPQSLGAGLAGGCATFLLLHLFGHFIPRLLARMHAEKLVRPVLVLQEVLAPLLLPFSWAFGWLQRAVMRAAHWDARFDFLTDDERQKIEHVARRAAEGQLEEVEREMIRAVLDFGDTTVREIMTPRIQMVTLPLDAGWTQVMDAARESRYSRIPVHRDNVDDIVGLLHVSDLLFLDPSVRSGESGPEGFRLEAILRPAFFVPASKRISDLMRDFREQHTHLLLAVDEHGGIAGIVTLEDVLEEIVGEIADETDEENPPLLRPAAEGEWEADGEIRLDELREELAKAGAADRLPPEDDAVETLAGLVMHLLGALPAAGDEVRFGPWVLRVVEMEANRVARIRLRQRGTEELRQIDSQVSSDGRADGTAEGGVGALEGASAAQTGAESEQAGGADNEAALAERPSAVDGNEAATR